MELTNEMLVRAITDRHSVRAYTDRKIETEKLEELSKYIEELNNESGMHLQLIDGPGKTYGNIVSRVTGLKSAPYIIACVGPDDVDLDEKAGYYGEKVVLLANILGLDTCWTGFFSRTAGVAQINVGERISIVIALGYGKDHGRVRKSRSFDDVTDVSGDVPSWFRFAVDMALLAPTAMNQQKFLISLGDDGKVTFKDLKGPYSGTDIGIVKCHFEIGEKYSRNDG